MAESDSGPGDSAEVDADLRAALQHQKAALEQRAETERELKALIAQAERLLARVEAARKPPKGGAPSDEG